MVTAKLEILAVDGAEIAAAFSKDETQPIKGVVVFSHGFGEHMGNYKELAKRLASAGYASIAFDQRGHGALLPLGKRKKKQGVIPSYQCFLDDVDTVIAAAKDQAPGAPVVLYGHSMGGNIVLNYLLCKDQSVCACAVLESPWLGLHKALNSLVTCMAKVFGRISRHIAIINKLSPADLTGEAEKADGYTKDELYHNRMSMRMLSGVLNGCDYALNNASKISIPIFIASAEHDVIVSNTAIGQFVSSAGQNVTHKEYDSHHAIKNDKQREFLYKDVVEFIDGELRTS